MSASILFSMEHTWEVSECFYSSLSTIYMYQFYNLSLHCIHCICVSFCFGLYLLQRRIPVILTSAPSHSLIKQMQYHASHNLTTHSGRTFIHGGLNGSLQMRRIPLEGMLNGTLTETLSLRSVNLIWTA